MKQFIKDFLPPILMRLLKKLAPNNKEELPKQQLVYASYNDALSFSTNDAYEERELLEVVLKKTKRFSEELKSGVIPVWETGAYTLMSLINPIIESKKDTITVLDFAGACGAHYFHVRSLLSKEIKLEKTASIVRSMTSKWTEQRKTFRYLNRYKLRFHDTRLPFVIDLSIVKSLSLVNPYVL
mgnify:CR=1 FL=1